MKQQRSLKEDAAQQMFGSVYQDLSWDERRIMHSHMARRLRGEHHAHGVPVHTRHSHHNVRALVTHGHTRSRSGPRGGSPASGEHAEPHDAADGDGPAAEPLVDGDAAHEAGDAQLPLL